MKRNGFWAPLLMGALFLLAEGSVLAGQNGKRGDAPPAALRFTTEEGAETTSFSCADKIYCHIPLPQGKGQHPLKVLWIRPDGEVEQETPLSVKLDPQSKGAVLAWVVLGKKQDGWLDDFSLGGSYGRQGPSFQGDWTVHVLLDNDLIHHDTLKISCFE